MSDAGGTPELYTREVVAVEVWVWVVLAGVTALAVAVVWWKRRARRVYVIDHVRVEMHPACVVEDRVIEHVWRAAISMTNTSRRPRALPVLAERATVRVGRRAYLAHVHLDTVDVELNPGGVALAWVEFELPSGALPARIETHQLPVTDRPTPLRWVAALRGGSARATVL